MWQRARVRAEDEDVERDVTVSTAGATNTISYGGRSDSLLKLMVDDPEQYAAAVPGLGDPSLYNYLVLSP